MVGRNTEVAVMTPDSGDWAIRTSKRPGGGYVTDLSWSPRGDVIYFGLNAAVPMGALCVLRPGRCSPL